MSNTIDFWAATDDAEQLYHQTKDECIGAILDDMELEDRTKTLTIYGYAHMEPYLDWKSVLSEALDDMDIEYADPEGDGAERTDKMIEAAKDFADVMESEYVSWMCECVTEENIDVDTWISENRPD